MEIKREPNKSVDAQIKAFKERFELLKQRLSKLRKGGKETSFVDPLVLNFVPKLKMALATYAQSDVEKVQKFLDYFESEIEAVEKDRIPERVVEIIQEAYQAYWDGKTAIVEEKYKFIKDLYDTSKDPDMKRLVYYACIDLYNRLVGENDKVDPHAHLKVDQTNPIIDSESKK